MIHQFLAAQRTRRFIATASAIAALSLACDQIIKLFVRVQIPECRLEPGQFLSCPAIGLAGQLALVHVENPGTGTHWFRTNGEAVVLGLLSVLVIALYAIWLVRAPVMGTLATGIQLGGTVGNLLDHLLRGSATDVFRANSRYTVNLADALIVIGGLLAVLTLVWVLFRPTRAASVQVLDST